MSEQEVFTPAELAAIEQGFSGLVPLDEPSHLKALDIGLNGGEFLLGTDFSSTKSGVTVNTRTALEISAVMACTTVIAEDVGKMPCHLYRWLEQDRSGSTPTGRSERETRHPYAHLLTDLPNPDMTDQAFRETMTLFALLTGNGYAFKVRDGAGLVAELWPLVPGSCVPRRDAANWRDLYYDIWFEDGTHRTVWPSEVFRLSGISWDGVCGINRVKLAREVFGLSKRLTESQARFYGKDQRPSGIVTTDKVDEKLIARIQETWQKQFGPDGPGGTAVLDGGFKYEAMTISAKDADSIALWRLLVEEACRVFRVQPLKVMHATGTQSYASVDVLNQAHLTDTLEPWLLRWEKETWRDLLAERAQEDGRMYVRFNRNAYLRPLPKDRYAIYQQARQSNLLSVNEIRDLEELEPDDDARADDLFSPIGTNPLPAPARGQVPGARGQDEGEKPKPDPGDDEPEPKPAGKTWARPWRRYLPRLSR